MTTPTTAEPGTLDQRPAPSGLPDPRIQPPTIAEAGDPFAALRVIDLVARLERGRPIRLDDLVDRLNAAWTSTGCSRRAVVVDALIQLQANWMADYRNASGIVLDDGPVRPDGHHRGLEPGRPLDRPPGPAHGRRRAGPRSTSSRAAIERPASG